MRFGLLSRGNDVTDEQKQQIEEFIRVGCAALQHGKQLEDTQQIGATALSLIDAVRNSGPQVKPSRKRS